VAANAVLTIDGAPTTATGPVRSFVSDEMKPDSAYDFESLFHKAGFQRFRPA